MTLLHASRSIAVAALCALGVCGCVAPAAGPPVADPAILADATFRVVAAREAGGGAGPRGIAETFSTEGVIYGFVSITWPVGHRAWGPQTFESRWYSGDRLVSTRSRSFEIMRSPYNLWSSVLPINLGPGPARYELYANGRKVAEKSIVIVAPAGVSSGLAPVAGGPASGPVGAAR